MADSTAVAADVSSIPKPRWGRRVAIILALLTLGLLVKFILHLVLPRNFTATGEQLPLELPGPPFYTLFYNQSAHPKGIVILATGDGGWSYWEENTAQHLIGRGYAVGGWDCRRFADTRTYDHDTLARGFAVAVEVVRAHSGAAEEVPVWYAGWSTGAEQSVAAAAWPERPKTLTGLLLAAPGRVGRYGITTSDLLGKEPSGPGTFVLADLGPALRPLRVVQFTAGLDPLDDASWLATLPTPHRLVKIPGVLHDMGGAGARFQGEVDQAMVWTLQPQI